MPALPAGLSSIPAPSAAATTHGWFHSAIGTTSGTKLHAMATVRRPVANRSITQGAMTAPTMPASPATASTSPMWKASNPPVISRSTATKKRALTARLVSALQTVSTRKNGRAAMNRTPSARSWPGRRRGPSYAAGARSVRIRPSITQLTAKDTASAAKGSHRATAYSTPPSGALSRAATCRRAWFWLSAVGSSSGATTARTADISAGAKRPAPTPVSSATTSRCGTVSVPRIPATPSEV